MIESLLALVPTILLLTDSHGVGAFGYEVEDALRRLPGAQVDTYAMGGATPDSFFDGFKSTCTYVAHTDNHTPPGPRACGHEPTPRVEEVLHGQVAVIALGTNLLWNVDAPGGWERAGRSVRRMAEYAQAHSSLCLWVGPPDMRILPPETQARFYALLGELPCELVDSREFTHYPAVGGDGCHYGGDAEMNRLGGEWGRGVAAQLLARIKRS